MPRLPSACTLIALPRSPPRRCRARDLWLQGIQSLRRTPNSYLYQSLAVLAAEMDCVEEARKWFREGTRTLTVSTAADEHCLPMSMASHEHGSHGRGSP